MFGQRLRVTDLALHTGVPAQTGVLRAIASLEDLCRACARGLPTLTGGNIQLVAALGVGIFIGSGAAAFLTGQAVIALGLVAPLYALAMFQLPRQQPEQTLPEQEVQPCDEQPRQKHSGVMAYLADEAAMTPLVEDALRHLYDRSYLGQHRLAQLHIIRSRKWARNDEPGKHTHLSLGHALHSQLVEVIEQLRPAGLLPTGARVPGREWHPYVILHAQYVQRERTREVMARLYIGEGTYNRTRRAVQSIARAILELEHRMEGQSGCP